MGVRVMAEPSKVLKLHQHVTVEVISVDLERNRIGLKLINKDQG
jgi:ribosomal protein S1